MENSVVFLLITATSIGFFHTLLGPDHYLPFIVMSKARKWSVKRTVLITSLCGLGHVLSSVVLGLIGVFAGMAVSSLEVVESIRGNWAAWGLIVFGLMYFIYGVIHSVKNKPHTHTHFHIDGNKHNHVHGHSGEHAHVHEQKSLSNPIPWALFIVFVLGPCEPLIPLLMYPALKFGYFEMLLVASVFSFVTIATMIGTVLVSTYGMKIISFKPVERYIPAFSGFVIFMCGISIKFLGL